MSSVCCCLLRGPRPFFGDGSAVSPPTAVLFIPKPYVPDTISEKYELNNAHYYSEYFICLLFISLFAHNCVQNSSRSKTYFLSTQITLNIKCHCLTISNTKLTFITIQLEQQTSYTLLYRFEINFKKHYNFNIEHIKPQFGITTETFKEFVNENLNRRLRVSKRIQNCILLQANAKLHRNFLRNNPKY